MLHLLYQTFQVDIYTRIIVALLSGCAAFLTKQALSRTMLAMLFTPVFAFGALVTNYLFEQYAICPTPNKETNVVVACTLGMILMLLVLLIVTRFGRWSPTTWSPASFTAVLMAATLAVAAPALAQGANNTNPRTLFGNFGPTSDAIGRANPGNQARERSKAGSQFGRSRGHKSVRFEGDQPLPARTAPYQST